MGGSTTNVPSRSMKRSFFINLRDIWVSLTQLVPHVDAVEAIDEVDAVFGGGHEGEVGVGHEPHSDVGNVEEEPHVPLFDESLDGNEHRDDGHDGGKRIEPELRLGVVIALQGLEADFAPSHRLEECGDVFEQPRAEIDEEETEAEGTDSDDKERSEALTPRHVACLDAASIVVTATLLPGFPPKELHGQIVEQTLQEVTVDVGAETDIDMQHTFDDAEEPVGHGTLGTQDDTEDAEDGGDAGDDAVETIITLEDPRDYSQRHDGQDQKDLEPVEAAEGEPKQRKIAITCHLL